MTIFVSVVKPPYRVSFEKNGEWHNKDFDDLAEAEKYCHAIKLDDLEQRVSDLEKRLT